MKTNYYLYYRIVVAIINILGMLNFLSLFISLRNNDVFMFSDKIYICIIILIVLLSIDYLVFMQNEKYKLIIDKFTKETAKQKR